MPIEIRMLLSPLNELPDVVVVQEKFLCVQEVPKMCVVVCGMDVVMALATNPDDIGFVVSLDLLVFVLTP